MKKKWKIGVFLIMLLVMAMPVHAQAAGKVRALVISGNDLMWHKDAAQRFANALKDNKLPTYETSSSNIKTFYYHGNASASKEGTTKDEFKAAIKKAFKNSKSSDLNIFYYSGHGAPSGSKHAILLNKGNGWLFSGVAKELAKYKGKYIVIFNACYDGAFVTEGLTSLSKKDRSRFTCITSITDSDSSVGVLFPNMIFSGSGLDDDYKDLKADTNHDGMIMVSEIAKYAQATYYVGTDRVLFHFESIDLPKSKKTLYDGEGYRETTLEVNKTDSDPNIDEEKQYIKWTTSNSKVATVDKDGNVTAKKPGTATITARYYGTLGRYYGAEDKCKITVKKPEITIKAVSDDKLYVDGTKTLKAECKGTKAKITWSSSNTSIATVDSNGVVTGKKTGTVTITAKNVDAKDTYKVTVNVDYKNLYYNFLKAGEKSYSYKEGSYTRNDVARSYYLAHLNSDKIPELLVTNSTPTTTYCIYNVFTIKNGKVTYCGTVSKRSSAKVIYNKKYKALHIDNWTNGNGGSIEILWKLSDGKLKNYKQVYSYNASNGKRKYQTSTNGSKLKNVSKSTYTSFYNKYFNKKDLKSYTLISNTEANRLKILK